MNILENLKEPKKLLEFLLFLSIMCISVNILFIYGMSRYFNYDFLNYFSLQDYINATIKNFIPITLIILAYIYSFSFFNFNINIPLINKIKYKWIKSILNILLTHVTQFIKTLSNPKNLSKK